MNFKTSDYQTIYYELTGKLDAKETLVFLNGLTQSTMAWGLMLPALKDQYKVVLLDFVFQGQSDKEGDVRDFDTHAKDVYELLQFLHIDDATLIGISYGSLVAQHYAVNYPDYLKRLVLMSTFAHKTPFFEAIENSWMNTIKMGGYELMLDVMLPYVLSDNYFVNPLIPIDLMKSARKDLNANPEAIVKLMTATQQRKDYRKELEKINVATLIVHGEKDLLLPTYLAQAVHEHIKKSKCVVLPNVGHTLNLEAVKESVELIKNFTKD